MSRPSRCMFAAAVALAATLLARPAAARCVMCLEVLEAVTCEWTWWGGQACMWTSTWCIQWGTDCFYGSTGRPRDVFAADGTLATPTAVVQRGNTGPLGASMFTRACDGVIVERHYTSDWAQAVRAKLERVQA